MKLDRLESLLWEDRDGTITADDRDALAEYFEEHPEAKRLQEEIESLAKRLDGLSPAVPPPNLRPQIDEALAQVPMPRSDVEDFRPSVSPHTSRRLPTSWFAMAASLLVGIAVGYLLQPGTGTSVEPAKVSGAMNTAVADPATETLEIALGGPSGSLNLSRKAEIVAAAIELDTTVGLEIDLEVADGFLLVTGVYTSDSAGVDMTTGPGRTVLRFEGPTVQRFELTATAGAIPIHLVVRENGVVVADDWMAEDPKSGNS